MNFKGRNLFKTGIRLVAAMLITKVLGLLREIYLARGFGTSLELDSYLIASMIPMILFTTIAASISTSFVPIFVEVLSTEHEKKAFEVSNNILNIIIVMSILVTIIGSIFSRYIAGIFAIGYSKEQLVLVDNLLKIMLPMIVFLGISGVFVGIQQALGRFSNASLVWAPHNMIIILYCIFFSKNFGITGLAYITAIGALSQILIQVRSLIGLGYRYKFVFNLGDKYIKKMLALISPVILGNSISQLSLIIDKMTASTLQKGAISALNFANRLFLLPVSIFIAAISTMMLSKISRLAVNNKIEDIRNNINKILKIVIMIILPLTVIFIVLRVDIIKLLFQRGKFDTEASAMTASALGFYSIGMIGFAMRDTLNSVFYALQDTKTPMKNGALAIIINIILNITLSRYIGYRGLALANATAAIVTALLLFRSLNNKLGNIGGNPLLVYFIKLIIISLISGAILGRILNFINIKSSLLNIICGSGILVVMYLILMVIFRIEEVKELKKEIFKLKKT